MFIVAMNYSRLFIGLVAVSGFLVKGLKAMEEYPDRDLIGAQELEYSQVEEDILEAEVESASSTKCTGELVPKSFFAAGVDTAPGKFFDCYEFPTDITDNILAFVI